MTSEEPFNKTSADAAVSQSKEEAWPKKAKCAWPRHHKPRPRIPSPPTLSGDAHDDEDP